MAQPREWQLQTAKARFSEVFGRARSEGPQRITRRGREAVIVLSAEQYDRLVDRRVGAHNLAELLANSPFREAGLDFERSPDVGREIEL